MMDDVPQHRRDQSRLSTKSRKTATTFRYTHIRKNFATATPSLKMERSKSRIAVSALSRAVAAASVRPAGRHGGFAKGDRECSVRRGAGKRRRKPRSAAAAV